MLNMQSERQPALQLAGCKLQVLSKHLLPLGSAGQGHNQATRRLAEGIKAEQETGGVWVRGSVCMCVYVMCEGECVGVWQAFITQLSQLELSNGSLCFKLCRHQLRLLPHACVCICAWVHSSLCVRGRGNLCTDCKQLIRNFNCQC